MTDPTLILGAGMTGLAAGIASGLPVLEAAEQPGGIHLVTRSGYREVLLSKLMRPAEALVVLLSPGFQLAALARTVRARLAERPPSRRSA